MTAVKYLESGDLVNIIGIAKFNTGISIVGLVIGVFNVGRLNGDMSVYKILHDDSIQLLDCNSRHWDFKKIDSTEFEEKEQ